MTDYFPPILVRLCLPAPGSPTRYLFSEHPQAKKSSWYNVMLCARGDGDSVRSRITYKGSRFEGGKTATGRQRKPRTTIA